MAATLLQSATANNSSPGSVSSSNLTFASPVTAGSLVVAAVSAYQSGSPVLGVSDNVNSTSWINAIQIGNANANIAILYFPNSLTGTMQVTVTQGGSPQPLRYCLQEWSGILALNPLDKVVSATNNSTLTPSSGNTAATNQATELVLGAISGASGTPTITAGGGATLDFQTVGRLGIEYQIVSAIGTQSAAFNYASSDVASLSARPSSSQAARLSTRS